MNQPDPTRPDPFRLLECAPSALLVVDAGGTVIYGNQEMRRLTGWTLEEGIGKQIHESIHPDDVPRIVESFLQLAGEPTHADWVDRSWAPTTLRMLDRHGAAIPVEVTGRTLLDDPEVHGVLYEIRPAWEREILQRVLTGFASGGELATQLGLIVDFIAAAQIQIDSVIVQSAPDGSTEVLAGSSPALCSLFERSAHDHEPEVFATWADEPQFVSVDAVGGALGAGLAELGFADARYVDVVDGLDESDASHHRILSFTEQHHSPALGVIDRMTRGAELTSFLMVRERSHRHLDRAAHHDSLTGLPNRLGLERRIADDRRRPSDPQSVEDSLTVMFVDLDGFKKVNDLHGHEIGDQVLCVIADRIDAATRSGDLAARFGGDEFAVVLDRKLDDADVVDDVAARIVAAVATPVVVGGIECHLTASVGLIDAASATDLGGAIAAADRAMYEAKRSGGGRAHRGELRAQR